MGGVRHLPKRRGEGTVLLENGGLWGAPPECRATWPSGGWVSALVCLLPVCSTPLHSHRGPHSHVSKHKADHTYRLPRVPLAWKFKPKLLSLSFKTVHHWPMSGSQASVTVDDSPSPKHVLPSSNAIPLFKLFLYLKYLCSPLHSPPMPACKRPALLKALVLMLLSPRNFLKSLHVN